LAQRASREGPDYDALCNDAGGMSPLRAANDLRQHS